MGEKSGELESARVARVLRDDIVTGRRKPGSKLVERDIAARLNVSRLPVREAIRALVTEGLVVSRPRTYAVVREYTRDDVREFAEVRGPLETMLFTYAAERHDEAGLAGLLRVLEREEQAARDGDLLAAQNAAVDFHAYMTVLARNAVLVELVGVFGTRLKWIFGLYEEPDTMAVSHRELYTAIAARDVELVRSLVAAHLAEGFVAAERRFGLPDEASAG
ncbi:GntR family transcriptional regulator [Microbacterium sp. YMB-B2]|uniref:GntR family transcriptional regulator n=1 Tax=Microbacterium tenebrionis TaxID=2830665 RepID=A0A9X1LNF5_9MICO|nr:GntR family transcriptional regulator [Microbacterium tenebrionis]